MPPARRLVLTVAVIIFIIGTILLARAWFHRATTEIAVTDRRIIYKRGFVRRFTVEMNMDKVANPGPGVAPLQESVRG